MLIAVKLFPSHLPPILNMPYKSPKAAGALVDGEQQLDLVPLLTRECRTYMYM